MWLANTKLENGNTTFASSLYFPDIVSWIQMLRLDIASHNP